MLEEFGVTSNQNTVYQSWLSTIETTCVTALFSSQNTFD